MKIIIYYVRQKLCFKTKSPLQERIKNVRIVPEVSFIKLIFKTRLNEKKLYLNHIFGLCSAFSTSFTIM